MALLTRRHFTPLSLVAGDFFPGFDDSISTVYAIPPLDVCAFTVSTSVAGVSFCLKTSEFNSRDLKCLLPLGLYSGDTWGPSYLGEAGVFLFSFL